MANKEEVLSNGGEKASAAKVDLKLEAVVIPVSDVDRSKQFYSGLGWRLDADFAFDNGFRVVEVTPPGSGCSIQFGIAMANMNRPRPSITGRTGTRPTSSHARTGALPTRQPRMPSFA
jgi:catechol 2,3-dioxygenase-like lactoylglutathione lyase family enzyme